MKGYKHHNITERYNLKMSISNNKAVQYQFLGDSVFWTWQKNCLWNIGDSGSEV